MPQTSPLYLLYLYDDHIRSQGVTHRQQADDSYIYVTSSNFPPRTPDTNSQYLFVISICMSKKLLKFSMFERTLDVPRKGKKRLTHTLSYLS